MKSKALWTVLSLVIVLSLLWTSCSKTTTTTPVAPPAPAATSAPAPTPTAPPAAAAPKTLKIGLMAWFSDPVGLDMIRAIELLADMENKNGGLAIGSDRYKIEIVKYDNGGPQSQATEVAAVNRMVFQDKVNFICTMSFFMNAWLSVTDANKVVVAGFGPDMFVNLQPGIKYSFNPTGQTGGQAVFAGWFCKNYPDLVKSIVIALPDNMVGHIVAPITASAFDAYGQKLKDTLFYPPTAQDLSSLGTQVKTLNPSAFMAEVGGPVGDSLAYKAVYQSGYRGQFFSIPGVSTQGMLQMMPAEMMEGLISVSGPEEFEPALNQVTRDFKAAWIAKYGKWEAPNIGGVATFVALKGGLEKAGSIDADKVAAAVYSGLEFESPMGPSRMINRPDLGNDRTVDCVNTTYIKQIKSGQTTLLTTVSPDEALVYVRKAFQNPPPPPPPPPKP